MLEQAARSSMSLPRGLDFRLRFSINQIAENFSWVRSQLWTISQSIRDLLRHLAKLEILIAVLDSSLERLEQQVHQLLFQPMQARIKPKAKPVVLLTRCHLRRGHPASDNASPQRRRRRRWKQYWPGWSIWNNGTLNMISCAENSKPLQPPFTKSKISWTNRDQGSQIESDLQNSERLLRQNGLLAEGEDMSKTSSSEME